MTLVTAARFPNPLFYYGIEALISKYLKAEGIFSDVLKNNSSENELSTRFDVVLGVITKTGRGKRVVSGHWWRYSDSFYAPKWKAVRAAYFKREKRGDSFAKLLKFLLDKDVSVYLEKE